MWRWWWREALRRRALAAPTARVRRAACVIAQARCVDGSAGSLARIGPLDTSLTRLLWAGCGELCRGPRGAVLGALVLELARVCN